MKFSIIIPTYNRVNYLAQTIESALSQNYENFEVIVSDNASTDETKSLVEKYKNNVHFKYFKNNTNIGMVANWRKAVFKLASGEWFIILSDDDYLIDNNFLKKASELIKQDEAITLLYSGGYILNESSKKQEALNLPFSGIVSGLDIFLSRGKVQPQDFILCSVIFKRKLAIEQNSFSNPTNLCCDSELFLLSCLYGNIGIIEGKVAIYRQHSSNLTNFITDNPILSFGNLDMAITPYITAKKMGFNLEAEAFRKNIKLDLYIVLNTLRIANEEKKSLKKYKDLQIKRLQKISEKIYNSVLYKTCELICLLAPQKTVLRLHRFLLKANHTRKKILKKKNP